MGSTNYFGTFIRVAEDCPVDRAEIPHLGAEKPTVAALQYELLAQRPHVYTSDDALFEVHALRQGIAEADRAQAREDFFAKSQACLRASPLPKRYGWGLHYDAEGRVALVPLGSDEYRAEDESLKQLRAMRSKRA